jgi:hypothetical protein
LQREEVVELELRHRLPGMHFSLDYVRAGGLMSYGIDLGAQFRRSAWYVARILNGAKPAELAVEQPARMALAINEDCQGAGTDDPAIHAVAGGRGDRVKRCTLTGAGAMHCASALRPPFR